MKLWQKSSSSINKEIERFTIGKDKEMDLFLAKHDVLGTLAHIKMLESIDLLTHNEWEILTQALQTIYREIEAGNFVIEDGIEDVHSQVESLLTERLGDIGKKIHSGRSRNDQVLVDLKLFIRHELQDIVAHVQPLFDLLIAQSNKYKDVLLPGYTHYQVAMPSSFGLWFGAYAESLVDDMILLQAAYKVANKNPLGSAAGYGSSFPLKRQMTTDLLGFEQLNYNVVYAQMGRGKTEKVVASALASIASTLAKLSQDVCLYISQNFGFISFPTQFTTGSSIMPHKKNPDVFELIRAKSNKIIALPTQIALITANLASGYHRDLQMIKESFLPVFQELKDCLSIATSALAAIEVKENIVKDKMYQYMFSVEVVNKSVLDGMPFRDAYKKIGDDINDGTYEPLMDLNHTHEGSIGNLCNDKVVTAMDEVIRQFNFDKVIVALEKLITSQEILI